MQFQFINGAAIDADARKQIRSSVMLGRNAGKRRRREQSKPKPRVLLPDVAVAADQTPTPTVLLPSNTNSTSVGTNTGATNRNLETVDSEDGSRSGELVRRRERTPLYRPFCDDVAVMIYPRVVGYAARKRISDFFLMGGRTIYPAELCVPFAESHVLWLEYFQRDDAFFHCLLALAQSHADYVAGLFEDSPNTLRHLGNSYRCINENLTREGTPSNATIASVMSVAMHHNIRRAPGAAKVHLDALELMVEMRGGVDMFTFHRMLLQKLCRTDIEHSFQSGVRPRFYRDVFPHDIIRAMPSWSACSYEAFVTTTAAQIYNINLQCIFRDLVCAARYLNDTQGGPRLRPLEFQELLISVCYRLLHAHPLMDERPANIAEDACHLALLALMTTMLIRPAIHQSWPSYALVTDLLRCAVRAMGDSEEDDEFMLWLLFAGGISVLDARREAWLAERLGRCTAAMGVESWAAAREILARFPWIGYFHDGLGEDLWNSLSVTGVVG
ncbi:hypothetical protein TWF696_003265 [Orbilia brochopaga]|uniref:Uncharacterized protein n=1 Tax=Orbilia brochopaga TaxID=3140254 RepID=A0AAV9U1Q6_9PEZI